MKMRSFAVRTPHHYVRYVFSWVSTFTLLSIRLLLTPMVAENIVNHPALTALDCIKKLLQSHLYLEDPAGEFFIESHQTPGDLLPKLREGMMNCLGKNLGKFIEQSGTCLDS